MSDRLAPLRADDTSAQQTEHVALATLSRAEQMLEAARSIDEIKKIVDMAELARIWFRRAKLGESAAQKAEEIKLRAQRKGGGLLSQMERGHGPGRGIKNKAQAGLSFSPFRQAVEDAGLDRHEVVRFQQVAVVPAPEFNGYLTEKKKTGGEITQAELLHRARAARKQEQKSAVAEQIRTEPKAPPKGPFRVIAIDPPWKYAARAEDSSHRARNPYPSMDLDAIKALPVAALAHADCILWLWTTNAFLRQAFECIDAWGFEYKTMLTWTKDRMGLGDWLRGQTEHSMLSIRGKPTVMLTNQTTALAAPLREHSRKPDEFYAMVESLCPGNKLEMFARGPREGWQVWGAEA